MEQLESILKEKTAGVLFTVKKNYEKLISYMLISIIGTLVLSGFTPWLMGQKGPVYSWPTTFDRLLSMFVMLLIAITFIFFYWVKYTATTIVVDDNNNGLKTTLSACIKKLKRSFRQEVFFVLCLFLGWIVIARLHSQFSGFGNFWDIFRADILIAIAALAVLLGSYLFFRLRHYKKYITELQQYLSEFDQP